MKLNSDKSIKHFQQDISHKFCTNQGFYLTVNLIFNSSNCFTCKRTYYNSDFQQEHSLICTCVISNIIFLYNTDLLFNVLDISYKRILF